jgi:nitroimidazol reductase NimA-like FMN-containing flavoprotein (pyridoxamine 5'-phosphate oxidase superfamily)
VSILPSGRAALDEMARRVIDGNTYMVLGTLDPEGQPRLSPVFYTPARYRDFYWVSVPEAHHSRNVAERPDVRLVIFDSTMPPGEGEAVYVSATAREVPKAELPDVVREAFRTDAGTQFTPEELSGHARLRLYVARATSYEVHVRGSHPTHGRGYDSRQAADPTAT